MVIDAAVRTLKIFLHTYSTARSKSVVDHRCKRFVLTWRRFYSQLEALLQEDEREAIADLCGEEQAESFVWFQVCQLLLQCWEPIH